MNRQLFVFSLTFAAAAALAATAPVNSQEPLRLGVATFLSGPAAGPFGVPGRNGAELMIEAINNGTLPAPYDTPGAGGRQIEVEYVDESGGNTKQVQEFRRLAQNRNVEVVVGYISSGSCNAIAPVADELRVMTVLPVCGAASLFEEADRQYTFRTITHVASDNIAAALYVRDYFPDVRSYTGINQNYAFGQESWMTFVPAMEAINPDVQPDDQEAWPTLFSGQYASEISSLLLRPTELIHSSFWDGDLEAFIIQGNARGLFGSKKIIFTIGATASYRLGRQMPDGLAVGAHGPYGILAEHIDTPLNNWFMEAYRDRYGAEPLESAYHYAQSVLAVKVAYDKAAEATGGSPTVDDAVGAFEGMSFESLTTTVHMSLNNGRQAVHENGYGLTKWDDESGRPTVTDITFYPADCVMPPEGIKTIDWINDGMPGSSCIK